MYSFLETEVSAFFTLQCEVGQAINQVYEQLYTPPVKHMVIGPGCSSVCQPVTESVVYWNLTSVSTDDDNDIKNHFKVM